MINLIKNIQLEQNSAHSTTNKRQNMNLLELTIKQKIALGFATIGFLLLAGSSFFYRSLNQIQTAHTNIQTLAHPVQSHSNSLQHS